VVSRFVFHTFFRGRIVIIVSSSEFDSDGVARLWAPFYPSYGLFLHSQSTTMHNSFPEEKPDSPAGYLATQPGETLNNGRRRIIRKLGWGPRSSTWLGVDAKDPDNISALKVFTIAATRDGTAETEREFLQHSVKKIDDNVPVIVSAFYEESVRGKHLCLEPHVLGTSVEALRVTNTLDGGYLPVHTVQKVVFDVLGPLSQLHKQMIIHGGGDF